MINLELLAKILNDNFGEPFLVKDGVTAEISGEGDDKILTISIGRRDVGFTSIGEVVNTGTYTGMGPDTLVGSED